MLHNGINALVADKGRFAVVCRNTFIALVVIAACIYLASPKVSQNLAALCEATYTKTASDVFSASQGHNAAHLEAVDLGKSGISTPDDKTITITAPAATVLLPAETVTQWLTAPVSDPQSTAVCRPVPEYLQDDSATSPTDAHGAEAPLLDYSALLKGHTKLELKDMVNDTVKLRLSQLQSLYGISGPRTWLDHIDSLPDQDLFLLTKFAQRTIDSHQNPSSCEGKRFFRANAIPGQGLGSALHMLAEHLSYAMFHDRILTYTMAAPPMTDYVDPATCLDTNPFKCLFEELTSCWQYANETNTDLYPGQDQTLFPHYHGASTPLFGHVLQHEFGDMSPNAIKVWTRAQSTAYVMRLRPAAVTRLAEIRMNVTQHSSWTTDASTLAEIKLPVPFPLPAQTWSMHIRHGDKGGEMRLVPFEAFVEAAEQYSKMNPIGMRKWAFVSSEDPEVFEKMHRTTSLSDSTTTSNSKWHWVMSNIQRVNTGPFQQLDSFGNRTETTLSWLSEAMLALECDGFVGTRNSNWNRLIDQLRGIWVAGGRGPFLEVSREKDWLHYGW